MGFLTLIFGTMGCGKTAEVMKIVNKFLEENSRQNKQRTFMVAKPSLETRNSENVISSRNGQTLNEVLSFSDTTQINEVILQRNPELIVVEECHLLEAMGAERADQLVQGIVDWLEQGKKVVVSGLIQNCYGEPFLTLSRLCPLADEVINPHTNCVCGKIATRSQRLQIGYPTPTTDPVFMVDDAGIKDYGYSYEPRCNDCWNVPAVAHPNLLLFRQLLAENQELKKK